MIKISERVKEFCEKEELVRIAYADSEGELHIVPVWFAEVDGFWCFGTYTSSLKTRSLLQQPNAGWVVDGGENRNYKGATFSGSAESIGDQATRVKVYQALGMKYFGSVDHPEFVKLYGQPDDAATTYFRLKPKTGSSWEY
jgi:nitroimidazol reductase NimA-like FMN-containing flavoprotein (pyridoxamine 5'-phosphate oxidase superfamily)